MNSKDQLKIVSNLTKSIVDQFTKAQKAGEVPEEWDGFELRHWLAEKFAHETSPMGRTRTKAFRNHVATRNHL